MKKENIIDVVAKDEDTAEKQKLGKISGLRIEVAENGFVAHLEKETKGEDSPALSSPTKKVFADKESLLNFIGEIF